MIFNPRYTKFQKSYLIFQYIPHTCMRASIFVTRLRCCVRACHVSFLHAHSMCVRSSLRLSVCVCTYSRPLSGKKNHRKLRISVSLPSVSIATARLLLPFSSSIFSRQSATYCAPPRLCHKQCRIK